MSADPNELAALKKEFGELISHAHKFLVSALGILVLVTLFVEQEIRKYNLKESTLNKVIEKGLRDRSRAAAEIGRHYSEIQKEIDHAFPAVKTTNSSLRDSVKNLKPNENTPADAGQQVKTVLDALNNLILTELEQKRAANNIRALLGTILPAVTTKRIVGSELEKAQSEIKQFKEEKRNIPTPFGAFEIDPRLALLATFFYGLFAYLSFHSHLRNVRLLASYYVSICAPCKSICPASRAPFWLYHVDDCNLWSFLNWQTESRQRILAGVFHGTWLAFLAWLIWECLWRWESPRYLLFGRNEFWSGVAVASFIVCVLLALRTFFRVLGCSPSRSADSRVSNRIEHRSMRMFNRRAFLRLGMASVVTGIVVMLYWRRSVKIFKSAWPRKSRLMVGTLGFTDFVFHDKTKVAHHPDVCAGHLPARNRRSDPPGLPTEFHVHDKSAHKILRVLVEAALGQGNTDRAIRLLQEGIAFSPLSWHYYDWLIRLLGKEKRYTEIHALLKTALDNIKGLSKAERKLSSATLALKRLDQRINSARAHGNKVK